MQQPAQKTQVHVALDRALHLFNRGDVAGAKIAFATVQKLDARNAHALNGLGSVAAAQGEVAEAAKYFRAALANGPDLAMARDNLVRALLSLTQKAVAAGDPIGAAPLIAEAAMHTRGDPSLVKRVVVEAFGLSDRLAAMGRAECVEALRAALRLSPGQPEIRINLENHLTKFGRPGVLADYAPGVDPAVLGTQLVIVCFPKSGSTFLKSLLCKASGFPEQWFAYSYQENEQDLYPPHLLHSARQNAVIQQHCLASAANIHLMQAFGIRPIILVRNIYDVLLSCKEFLDGGAYAHTFYPTYPELEDAARFDFVLDTRAAWYLNFLASWQRAVRKGEIDAIWLTYEDLTANAREKIDEILRFHGIDPDPQRVAQAIEQIGGLRHATRFN
jgi:tetratricopeptide (TPR) repeat protein